MVKKFFSGLIFSLAVMSFFAPSEVSAQLSNLNDDFNDGSISSSWQKFKSNEYQDSESDGSYSILPNADTVWFNADTTGYTYKSVSGNFKVTTRALARRRNTTNSAYSSDIQYSGIMIRNPQTVQSGQENYVFNVVGANQIETKTTVNNNSTVHQTYFNSHQAELRLCRVGNTITTYHRAVGATQWTPFQTYTRPDFPSTLQAGMMTYAWNISPDIEGRYDYIQFDTVNSQADCLTDTVTTPGATATNTQTPTPIPTPVATSTFTPTPEVTLTATPTLSPIVTISMACRSDINQDGVVDLTDYSLLVNSFFQSPPENIRTDINVDGTVDLVDYTYLIGQFFNTCSE